MYKQTNYELNIKNFVISFFNNYYLKSLIFSTRVCRGHWERLCQGMIVTFAIAAKLSDYQIGPKNKKMKYIPSIKFPSLH